MSGRRLFLDTPFVITTVIDQPMVLHDHGLIGTYRTEITSLDGEGRRYHHDGRRHQQILPMADGSEVAIPAPPVVHGREGSLDNDGYGASHIYTSHASAGFQGLDELVERSMVEESEGPYRSWSMPPLLALRYSRTNTTPSGQMRGHSASDPGTLEHAGRHSTSGSRRASLDAQAQSPYLTAIEANNALVHPPTQPQSTQSSTEHGEIPIGMSPHTILSSFHGEIPIALPSFVTGAAPVGLECSISTHLLGVASSGKYSDLKVVLTSASNVFSTTKFSVHRVIVSQSPVLDAILKQHITKPGATIHLAAAHNFSLPSVFEFALQRYYGLELITKSNVYEFAQKALGEVDGLTAQMLRKAAMDLALCYAAAGAFLGQPDVVDAAFNLVLELFDWGTLETALQFGLHPDGFLVTYDSNSNSNSNSSKNENSDEKTDEKEKKKKARRTQRGRKNTSKPLHLENLNSELADKWAPRITSAAIKFLVQNLPSTFHFDRTGLSRDLQDRIPAHLREEYSMANRNPMLASLAFGDHPVPSPEENRASAILLALPYGAFQEVVEELRVSDRLSGDVVRSVLQERESRRASALQAYARIFGDGKDDQDEVLRELGYREFATEMHTVEYPFGPETKVIRHEYFLDREWREYQPEGVQSVIRKEREDLTIRDGGEENTETGPAS